METQINKTMIPKLFFHKSHSLGLKIITNMSGVVTRLQLNNSFKKCTISYVEVPRANIDLAEKRLMDLHTLIYNRFNESLNIKEIETKTMPRCICMIFFYAPFKYKYFCMKQLFYKFFYVKITPFLSLARSYLALELNFCSLTKPTPSKIQLVLQRNFLI